MTDGGFSDDPISTFEQDEFDRAGFVDGLVSTISTIDCRSGAVVGLVGKWGSGKTSVLKMLETSVISSGSFSRVLRINPWVFSDAGGLVSKLIEEFFRQFKIADSRLQGKIINKLAALSAALEPVGTVAGAPGAATAFSAALNSLVSVFKVAPSVDDLRNTVEEHFRSLQLPILVVVDDLDRLHEGEVLEVLKFMRLVGSFPNVVYVVAFDDDVLARQTELSWAERGHEYLEKILTTTIRVPSFDRAELEEFLHTALRKYLEATSAVDTEIPMSIIVRTLVETPRDAKRIAFAAVQASVATNHFLNMGELIEIEAIRHKAPLLFRYLTQSSTSGPARSLDPLSVDAWAAPGADQKSKVAEWLAAAPTSKIAIETVVMSLFPDAWERLGKTSHSRIARARWLGEGRLGAHANWQLYLSRISASEHHIVELAARATPSIAASPTSLAAFIADCAPEDAAEVLSEYFLSFPPPRELVGAIMVSLGTVWGAVERRSMRQSTAAHIDMLQLLVKKLIQTDDHEEHRDWGAWSELVMSSAMPLSSVAAILDVIGSGRNLEDERDPQAEYSKNIALVKAKFLSGGDADLESEWALGFLVGVLKREEPTVDLNLGSRPPGVLRKLVETLPIWRTDRPPANHEAVRGVFGSRSDELFAIAFPDEVQR